MINQQNKKPFKAAFLSPNDVHHYWQDRVNTENSIRKRMLRTLADSYKGARSLSPDKTFQISISRSGRTAKVREEIFSSDLASLFTKKINLKEKDNSLANSPTKYSEIPKRNIKTTRHNNGEHIPNTINESKFVDYLDRFAKSSYFKPNQRQEDAPNIDDILDDIRTDPTIPYSRKVHLMQRALLQNKTSDISTLRYW
ncbi:unnamed protein product [Blepharisma stoltei]|uniref:Uncharacterized protein n=1 Tax=Blepharisma stoltei TaxID=1481888 RepID=A0AAU9KJ80_9CILI|nr:unnamed protein product [Blepharisma stoltei]